MIYNRNVSGIEIMLRIDNYQSPTKHSFGDWWCDCGFSFKFGNVINYSVEHARRYRRIDCFFNRTAEREH